MKKYVEDDSIDSYRFVISKHYYYYSMACCICAFDDAFPCLDRWMGLTRGAVILNILIRS